MATLFQSILFSVAFISLLFLPGFAVLSAFKIKLNKFLISFSFSYAFFALTFVIANHYKIPAHSFTYWLYCCISLSLLYVIFKHRKNDYKFFKIKQPSQTNFFAASIILTISIYQLLFGSYTEIPADIYTHIERFQSALRGINNNSLGEGLAWSRLFNQGAYVWYFYIAIVASITHTPTELVVYLTTWITKTIFALGVFYFSITLFRDNSKKLFISIVATIFVILHMGINVFSFWRYYSLAPTMLNLMLYFTACVIYIQFINNPIKPSSVGRLAFIVMLLLAALTIHVQEALFIIIICSLITFQQSIRLQLTSIVITKVNRRVTHLLSLTAILCFVLLYLYAHDHLTRNPNMHNRLWEFGSINNFLPSITLLNLKFQFIRVTTLWGLFVYILFFLNWHRYKNNPLLIVGMLSPLFTFLNPVFNDLFLRLSSAQMLWRTCFLIPLHFVAADLFVHYLQQIRQPLKRYSRIICIPIVFLMILLLLPIKNTWKGVHYSRLPSLAEVPSNRSYTHINDLITFLNSIETRKEILTDPVTGYVISAMTHHISYRRKFSRSSKYRTFSFKDYSDNPLEKYKGHLLIINKRFSGKSTTGELANHWQPELFEHIHYYYPKALLEHLNEQDNYQKIWGKDQVNVYQIN